ncbi:hypothetical protein ACHAXN_004385 [Cyclotella atomus]
MPKKAREQDAKNKSIENPPTRNFFTPRVTAAASQSQSVPASQSESESAVPTEGIDDISKQTSPTDEDFVVDNDEEDVIDANLDIDEDETRADNHCDEGDLLNECDLGVQQEYVKAVQLRLGDEVREDNKSTDLYLLEHLKDNDWRIRKEHAPKFSRKLGLSKTNTHCWIEGELLWKPNTEIAVEKIDQEWDAIEEEIDDTMRDLAVADIELLRAAIFESVETEGGKVPLHCEGLDAASRPELIRDKFSATLGDVFHAMDRAKVPVKHESKKAYFVALRDAFLFWNPAKLKELEDAMMKSGMINDEIQAQKYHNARLYRECVDRKVPPSSILYHRVRAVCALFGNMIDSKTKKPLFSKKAWKKANNVLKDILAGYYSDPPGLNFYTKRLGSNGEAMTNKHGLEVIECFRVSQEPYQLIWEMECRD